MVKTRSKRKAEEELLRLEADTIPTKSPRLCSVVKTVENSVSSERVDGIDLINCSHNRVGSSVTGEKYCHQSARPGSNRRNKRKVGARLRFRKSSFGFSRSCPRKKKVRHLTNLQVKRCLLRNLKKGAIIGVLQVVVENISFVDISERHGATSAFCTQDAANDDNGNLQPDGNFVGVPSHTASHPFASPLATSSSSNEDDDEKNDEPSLPKRLFYTDRYPTDRRVNLYSKLQYLTDIVTILDGTEEFDRLMKPCFGCLFRLHVRRCSFSRKFVHNLLCRQVFSKNSHEFWFTFGGHPIRYSLHEFELVTGLPCRPYPDDAAIVAAQTPRAEGKPYLYELIGTDEDVMIARIVEILQANNAIPPLTKLRLVLIVIVDGILTCGTHPICPTSAIVEMVRDLDFFFSYPWGRLSFEKENPYD